MTANGLWAIICILAIALPSMYFIGRGIGKVIISTTGDKPKVTNMVMAHKTYSSARKGHG